MKKTMIILALLALPAGMAQAAENPDANRCIRVQDIRNTSSPNSKTILFHMRDGTVWRNTLKNSCSGLVFSEGFVHKNFGPAEYCGNREVVRTTESGQSCMLGDFSKEPPKPPKS